MGGWMFSLTFGGHAQVGHDHQHGVGLQPQHVGRHVLVVQRPRREDHARPVVHPEMTCGRNAEEEKGGRKKVSGEDGWVERRRRLFAQLSPFYICKLS